MARLMVAAVAVLSVQLTWTFPQGAPPDACSTNLVPAHGGNEAQPSPGPYTLVASSRTYSPNKPITVILKGSGHTFKGFMIQAQDLHTGLPIVSGEWRGASVKSLPCAAITHTSPASKTKVEVTWTPKGSGEVVFVATVVESFDTFYTGIKSSTRSSSDAANSFYDRDQKTRASSTYLTSSQGSSSYDQDAYQPQSGTQSEYDTIYDTQSSSQPKVEDDGETAASAADTQDQYDTNYYGTYDPNTGYSQPDYSAAPSSVVSGTAAPEQVGGETQQDQSSYYTNPNYQYQNPSYQFQSSPPRPQQQQQQSYAPQQSFASFQSPSFNSQHFLQPQYRRPSQFFRTPWNYQRF